MHKRAPAVVVALAATLAFFVGYGSSSQAPHCKMPDHLAVVAGGQGDSPAAVGYLPSMRCTNAPGYSGWGELINIRANRPDRGLHLFPESVAWMPGRLRAEAAHGGTVTVLHSVGGRLQTFAVFSNATALALADQIEAAAP